MKTKHLLLPLVGLVFLCSFIIDDDPILQSFKKKVVNSYLRYHEVSGENVYAHINKTLFWAGENIWLKMYVINSSTGKLSENTTNLYSDLYAPDGKLVDRKIWNVNSGLSQGQITLGDTVVSGNYTLKVYTNWMRNFETERIFTTSIQVYGTKDFVSKTDTAPTKEWDVQFFPEGGNLVAGVENHLAVKVLDPNGKGKTVNCTVKNSKGESLAVFKTNQLGFGDFNLDLQTSEQLTAEIEFTEGVKKLYQLPTTLNKGLVMMASIYNKDKIGLFIRTNQETFTDLQDKRLYCMVHSKGNIHKLMHFTLNQLESSINLLQSELPAGINTVTLFDETFKPISERLLFIHKKEVIGELKVNQQRAGDSISVTVSAHDTNGQPLSASLSISVLPVGTFSNAFDNHILAQFFLKSEIKGEVENPKYYFEVNDIQHMRDLDNLLLTQGWRKHNWNDILNEKTQIFPHIKENGFEVRGTVKNLIKGKPDSNSQVTLFASKPGLIDFAKVDQNGNFSFSNLLIWDSSRIVLTAGNNKSKNWNRSITANLVAPKFENTIFVKPNIQKNDSELLKKLLPGIIQLAEVVVKEKKKENPFKGDPYVNLNDKYIEITKDNYNKYHQLTDLLREIYMLGGKSSLRGRSNLPPVLILDGMVMTDLSLLNGLHITDIEAISVNRNVNAMLGSRGAGGSISIKTRRTSPDWGDLNQDLYIKSILAKGYSIPVDYYTPKYYAQPHNEIFAKYTSLFWQPNIITDSTGTAFFKYYLPKKIQEMEIRTEGISVDGQLFFKDEKVKLNQGS